MECSPLGNSGTCLTLSSLLPLHPTSSACRLTVVPGCTGTENFITAIPLCLLSSCPLLAWRLGQHRDFCHLRTGPGSVTWESRGPLLRWQLSSHLQSPAVTCRSQQLLLRKGFPHKPQKELSQVTPGCNTHIDSHLTVQEGGESCAQDLPGLLPVADDT